ncbi:MAG: ATP-binding protein, partial [Brucellaceae bacterium]|nr:ATP-binding protein [Brucellaceae bacterium]
AQPSSRADAGQDAIADLLSSNEHVAAIPVQPATRPQAQEQQVAMVMPQDVRNGKSGRVVAAAQNNAAVPAEAVRTTAKAGRSDRPAAKAAANAVLQPADNATDVAISNEPVAKVVPASNPVLRNDAMRQAPTVVYTAGFQKDLPAGNTNRFTGNAVTFIPIAKFSKIN